MRYRIETIGRARTKAKEYGLEGAYYAWESQEGGYEGCSDYNVTDVFTNRPMRTHFRDKQYHISAVVVYGFVKYTILLVGAPIIFLYYMLFKNDFEF